MRVLLSSAVVLALLWGAPAGAVIIASGDGTGNTSAPPDDPGWDSVVNLSGLTGVYLGNGWVLTANHVGARDMIIGGDVYEPVPNSKVRLETNGSDADLALFQIVRDPGLPDVLIHASPPPQTTEVVMIGHGRSRGAAISACSRDGWLWVGPSTMRWGTNRINQIGIDLSISGTLTRAFSTLFDAGLPTLHEAQAATGDSGGAVFVWNEATWEWELAGIMTARSSFETCQPSASALYGNHTYAADLSFYLDQIEAIASVPACDDGLDQDGDGLTDLNDPGCDHSLDPFETSDTLPCDDGIDNDGDGFVDHKQDVGCGNPEWVREDPACSDGLENDGDALIDFDGGQSIHGACSGGVCPPGVSDPDADGVADPDPDCVGNPWRNSEYPPASACGMGLELVLFLPPLLWLRRRRR